MFNLDNSIYNSLFFRYEKTTRVCAIASVIVVCEKQLLFFQMKFYFLSHSEMKVLKRIQTKNRMQIQNEFHRYDDFTAIYGNRGGSSEQKSLRSQMF